MKCDLPIGATPEQEAEICDGATKGNAPAPQPTAAMVLQELKRLTLQKGRITFQPSWGGLVNKAEIFYTTVPRERDRTITLLGQAVRVHMHIDSYHWEFGDDGDLVTTSPGAPYPNKDITHTYRHSGTYKLTLSLSYGATFSVAGGPAQPIDGEVTVTGPAVTLQILHAHSELVGH